MKKRIYILISFFLLCAYQRLAATPETIPGGAYIINMGVSPQTISNGLKPYGLVYDLIKNYKVPVKWVINLSKSKDGIDFSHNGINYSGGSFIILAEFRTSAVNSAISSWESQGVIGATTISAFSVEVLLTLHHAPRWTLDKANGAIAATFFANAGIPSSAYGGSGSSNWKDPSELSECDDIFAMPHADPTWNTHNNLYYWNQNFKGNIWAGCHAVSVLENITNPANTIQLNFLSSTGLVPFGSHTNGSAPYSYNNPTDPVMQFTQIIDDATDNGSERIYLPKLGGSWRPTTRIGVYDNTQANVPSASPGLAAVLAYGRAFGDNARGWVMYEGGHNLNTGGTMAERVAAQRAFFNFSFFSTSDKNAWFDLQVQNIPDLLVVNIPYNISFTVPAGVDLSKYTINWTSSCGGKFSSTNQQSVTFTPTATYTNCIITASLIDACGREVFSSKGVYVNGSLLSTAMSLDGKYIATENAVSLQWTCFKNQTVQYFEIEKSRDGNRYSLLKRVNATVNANMSNYKLTDTDLPAGVTYYRIKSVSADSRSEYSNVVRINTTPNAFDIQILSNPAKGKIILKCNSNAEDEISISMISTQGQVVLTRKQMIKNGESTIVIDPKENLTTGIYLLQLTTKSGTIVKKIVFTK